MIVSTKLKIVVLSAVFVVAAMAVRASADDALPAGVKGFSGRVRGMVAKKGEKNTFTFKVGRVLRVWKNNKAEKPGALVGLTVSVGPRWVKGDDGKWRPLERHVTFIKNIKAGQEMTLEIRNVERSEFAILELSQEQRALAGNREGGDREKASRGKARTSRTERLIKELRGEISRLKAENTRLRRKIEEMTTKQKK